jgi:hypothetical protein
VTVLNTQSIDTWSHLLLACTNPNIHKLRIKRHNNTIWEIHKLLLSNKISRYLILINVGKNNNKTQDNIVPDWLLPCSCPNKSCHYNARKNPDILLMINHPYNNPPPMQPTPNITIQFIEFTYSNNRFPPEKVIEKEIKHALLIRDIQNQRWTITPLFVIIARARGAQKILHIE